MNDQDKIAELTAEIARLHWVLTERQAKIGELMGEAARAGMEGAPVREAGEVPPSLLIRAYNSGYKSGHHDTVEAQYTDIDQRDMFTYHADVVVDMIADGTLAAPAAPNAPSEQAEKLMADMDTMRDEFASLSNALAFWLPTVPEQAGAIQDRIVHDVFFLGEHGEPKSAQDLGWITLNVGQSAPAAPLPAQPEPQGELLAYFLRSAYPVDTSIDARGYRWSEAYLDQARAAALAGAAPLPEQTGPSEAKIADERTLFEEWVKREAFNIGRGTIAEQYAWDAWQTRAARSAAPPSPAPAKPTGPLYEEQPDGTITEVDQSDLIIAYQVAVWRKEVARLNDLIAAAGAAPAQQQEPRIAVLEARLTAIAKWLEQNQSDVFRRGLWDVVSAITSESIETAAPGASIGDKQ